MEPLTDAPADGPTRVEVVVLRDPDASNTYAVFINGREVAETSDGAIADGVLVCTYDIDAGSSIEGQGPEVAREWADYHRTQAAELLTEAAADHVHRTVEAYDDAEFTPEVEETDK